MSNVTTAQNRRIAGRLGQAARDAGQTIDLDNGQPFNIYDLFEEIEGRDYDHTSHRDELAILEYAAAYENG